MICVLEADGLYCRRYADLPAFFLPSSRGQDLALRRAWDVIFREEQKVKEVEAATSSHGATFEDLPVEDEVRIRHEFLTIKSALMAKKVGPCEDGCAGSGCCINWCVLNCFGTPFLRCCCPCKRPAAGGDG